MSGVTRSGGPLSLLALAALAGAWLGPHGGPTALALWAVLCLFALANRRWLALGGLLVMAWCAGQVMVAESSRLPDGLAGQDVELHGRIAAVTLQASNTRLQLAVTACRALERDLPGCDRLRKVQLSWYQAPALEVGEQWRLVARLKPPHGYANPGAFDYRAWLLREGVGATGYVRGDDNVLLQPAQRSWRAFAHAYLTRHVPDADTRRWLAALTLGAGDALSRDEWGLLADTGTTHLMVISGLHVGLVALAVLVLSRLLSRLLFPLRWRVMEWPWLAAAGAALAYAALAGFGPAALRAAIMTAVALWIASGRHAPGVWQGWWLALLLVVVAMPATIQRSGLWLSFGAVAVLILAWRWRPPPGRIYALLRTQWLLTLATGAAVMALFGRFVPLAFAINLVAVPWVTLLLVPLGLLGWALAWWPPLAEACWRLFGWLLAALLDALSWLAGQVPAWSPAEWRVVPLAVTLGLWTALALLPGLSRRWRAVAALCLLPVPLWSAPPQAAPGTFAVTVYDVGQGELVEVRTAHYRLLFDTGPRLQSGFMPVTTLWAARQHFDTVVVSHADTDHAGGVAAIEALHDVASWRAPTRTTIAVPDVRPCRAGEAWRVDGVTFRFLWPLSSATLPDSENDRSCVLLIDDGRARALITGDAGTEVEKRLFASLERPVDLLVAGHHGSNTSSSRAFVIRARPRHVVFSAGYLNSYRHPHAHVVRRFAAVGSCLWNTAVDGAVHFTSGPEGVSAEALHAPPGVEGRCIGVESAF